MEAAITSSQLEGAEEALSEALVLDLHREVRISVYWNDGQLLPRPPPATASFTLSSERSSFTSGSKGDLSDHLPDQSERAPLSVCRPFIFHWGLGELPVTWAA